jgi:hypothetical protein
LNLSAGVGQIAHAVIVAGTTTAYKHVLIRGRERKGRERREREKWEKMR